jgi:hypothetical protein
MFGNRNAQLAEREMPGEVPTNDMAGLMTTPRAAIGILTVLIIGALLATGSQEFLDLHIILDTSAALLSGVLTLLLWDMGVHAKNQLPQWFAISFAVTGLLELVHVLVTVEWFGPLAVIKEAQSFLRPATWPPAAHLLPIGMSWALWRRQRGNVGIWGYALALVALGAMLFAIFQKAPTYLPPSFLGITRPALILAPLFWVIVAVMARRLRPALGLLRPVLWMTAVLIFANGVMLYSRAPADGPAMAAHLGKISGYLILLFSVMRLAAQEVRARIVVEAKLARLNEDLDQLVSQRTAQLAATNETLEREMAEREQAEAKTHAQVQRLSLLHQITRAIGERQDLDSIFQVAVRSVETGLPADFVCLCLYDDVDRKLTVSSVGVNSQTLSFELAMPERAQVDIDENGLSQCVQGRLAYHPSKRLACGNRIVIQGIRL